MSGREISARPLVPYKVNSKFVAVATEQKIRPVAPLENRNMIVVVSSERPG